MQRSPVRALVLATACVVLWLTGSGEARVSVHDPHNRELHGPSVRHLAERMARNSSTGIGVLTDGESPGTQSESRPWRPLTCSPCAADDVALLFLRYQREFNRSIASGAYSPASMTEAFQRFGDNARRYASLLTDPDTAPRRGIELALNELADVDEEEWLHHASLARRRLLSPFDATTGGVLVHSHIHYGVQPPAAASASLFSAHPHVVSPSLERLGEGGDASEAGQGPRMNRPGYLYGTVAAKAGLLDYLYMRQCSRDADALVGVGSTQRAAPTGLGGTGKGGGRGAVSSDAGASQTHQDHPGPGRGVLSANASGCLPAGGLYHIACGHDALLAALLGAPVSDTAAFPPGVLDFPAAGGGRGGEQGRGRAGQWSA